MTQTHPIISAEWLFQHLDDPQIAIADCRFSLADPELGQQQYLHHHIPGAHYLHLNRDLSSPVQRHGGRHPLPDSELFAQKLGSIGVTSPDVLLVIYDDSRFAFAARLWWLMRYLGHDRVAILEGGFKGWQTAGYPVTDAIPRPSEGTFIPQIRTDRLVDIETVKTRSPLPEVALIDSRERDRYLGNHEPIDPIAGHIPGALNYPWQEVTDENAQVRPQNDQVQRWADIAGSDEIIVYCGSGVTACVNLLSLEIAGIPNAKLYAGSWSDWCSYQVAD
ncbi:sulfurtransferase [Oscillatoria acuminata]|uniref:Rhodanese-related sulfurtransferase n=1 Tax=Oscillatoria acuminata PCC 6304 TaxID=56110 RepID=K9TQK0_9CYAN|nr:sulfurtransferase [Oscillatoria acuminata]AFY84441.1 rhodanese-related sulfurtransferase [Oscillatoria acuminata PCC 6304]